jgi:hypothetical protein
MALAADDIARHPGLHAAIRQQSRLLVQAFEGNPRLASVFGTQHRWLMAQTGLALHFRGVSSGEGLRIARFLDLVSRHKVASRNTADGFLKEMVKYGFARQMPGVADRRARPLEPTEVSLAAVDGWLGIHLATLDGLAPERRLQTYLAEPGALAVMQPLIADGLLSSAEVREPERTFSLFTWLNNGGQVMDKLIAGIEDDDPDSERVPTRVESIADMAGQLKLSRTHLSRKLRDAEALGSIGWLGQRGHSVMWVSADFRREYARAQATKLAIIDSAFDACFGREQAEAPPLCAPSGTSAPGLGCGPDDVEAGPHLVGHGRGKRARDHVDQVLDRA